MELVMVVGWILYWSGGSSFPFFRPCALLSSRLFSRVLTVVISLLLASSPLSPFRPLATAANTHPLPHHSFKEREILLHCWGEPNPPRDVCSHRRRRRRLPMRVWARAAAKQLVSVSSISCHTHTKRNRASLSLALYPLGRLSYTRNGGNTQLFRFKIAIVKSNSRFQRVLLDIRPQISSGAPPTAGPEIPRISPVIIQMKTNQISNRK